MWSFFHLFLFSFPQFVFTFLFVSFSLSLSSCPLPLAETVTLGLSGTECRGALRQKRQRDSHEGREAGRTAAALLWLCPHPTPSPSAASSENVPQALLDPQASSRRLGDPLLACHHYSTPICNICLCSSFASYHPLCHSPALAPPPHPLLGLCHQDAQQQWWGSIITVARANDGGWRPWKGMPRRMAGHLSPCLLPSFPSLPRSSCKVHSSAHRPCSPVTPLLPEIQYVSLHACLHAVAL